MRSLFFKIFFFFWLSTALIFASFMVTSTRAHEEVAQERLSRIAKAVLGDAQALLWAYDEEGCAGVQSRENVLSSLYEVRVSLLKENGEPLCGPQPASAVNFGTLPKPGTIDLRAIGGEGIAVTSLSYKGRTYVVLAKRPEHFSYALLPWAVAKHLLGGALISALTCLLLAQYLVAPISRIRSAARQIAAGQLDARAGRDFRRQRDEVGDLVVDFDFMAEQLQLLIGAQQRLLSDVSHELRSPLTRLKLALELARREPEEGRNRALERIDKEADRLNDLIGRLLSLSRLETASSMSETSLLPLADFLREIVADLELEVKSRECLLAFENQQDVWVEGNPELLRSAFENVICNALRYTPAASTVQIRMHCSNEENTPRAKITIEDRGPGVPQEELENIFKPFYRLDAARERSTGGVGLGLAIAQKAIRLHRGQIWARNADQGGLVIEIILPQVPPPA